MNQTTLFDTDGNPTSRDALDALEPGDDLARGRMLVMFRERGWLTANEAAQLCVDAWGEFERETYRKRVHELVSAGLLEKQQTRFCRAKPGRTRVTVYGAAKYTKVPAKAGRKPKA